MDRQVGELERQIRLWHRESEPSRKLEAIVGVGPITASAMVATLGDAKSFKNARQVPAWLVMALCATRAPGQCEAGQYQQAR